jgi:hypothetical protein
LIVDRGRVDHPPHIVFGLSHSLPLWQHHVPELLCLQQLRPELRLLLCLGPQLYVHSIDDQVSVTTRRFLESSALHHFLIGATRLHAVGNLRSLRHRLLKNTRLYTNCSRTTTPSDFPDLPGRCKSHRHRIWQVCVAPVERLPATQLLLPCATSLATLLRASAPPSNPRSLPINIAESIAGSP